MVKTKGPGGDVRLADHRQRRASTYTHKFKKAGTYKLICTVHEDMKMKVKVN